MGAGGGGVTAAKGRGRGCITSEGEGGAGTQKCVYQKWPDQIFHIANFFFFPR